MQDAEGVIEAPGTAEEFDWVVGLITIDSYGPVSEEMADSFASLMAMVIDGR